MTADAAAERSDRLLGLAHRLAEEFADRAEQYDRENRFPFENFERLKRERYTALTIPQRFGGLGADLTEFARCQEELATGCGSTALAVNMHLFALGALGENPPHGPQGELLLRTFASSGMILGGGFTEPEIGGNWGYPTTTAVEEGGIYRINGRKAFTSLAPIIDFFVILTSVQHADGSRRIGTFVIPRGTPGIEIVESWDTLGMRATQSHDVLLRNVAVPAAFLAQERDLGIADEAAVLLFAWFACSIAGVYTGIARAARDFAVRYARERRPVVLERPIGHMPGVQFAVAEMDVSLAAMRALRDETARAWVEGRIPRDPEGLARVMYPKFFATNQAIAVVSTAMGIVGGAAISKRLPLERYYRDVRAGTFHPLGNDQARELFGKVALGIGPDTEPRWG